MVAWISVPRPPGASRNATRPWFLTSAPGPVSQASSQPGSSSVRMESHSTWWPAGALTTQCERVPSRTSTRSMFSMKRARLAKSRKKANTSSRGLPTVTARTALASSLWRSSLCLRASSGTESLEIIALALLLPRARLGHAAMHFGQLGLGGDRRDRRLDLVLQAGDHIAFTLHHRLEAGLGDLGRVGLLVLADLGVHHPGALEELRVDGPGHQAGDRDAGVLQLVAQGEGEAVHERLGAVVDRLEGPRHQAGDRSGEEDAAAVPLAHAPADRLHEIERADDVGVDDVAGGLPGPGEAGRAPAARGSWAQGLQ